MTKPEISGIAPLFIVNNVSAALAFYRDRLGFDITFQGPEPDDIFFGIVERNVAMIMFKDVGVDPVPNYTRDLGGRVLVAQCRVFRTTQRYRDGLRGFELKDADGYVLFVGRPRP